MRNNKFKLSAMIPNAWFYKLKEIGKPKNQTSSKNNKKPSKTSSISSKPNPPNQNQNQYIPRKSYYFTRNLNQNNNNNNLKLSSSSPPKTPSKNRTRKTCSSPKLVSADCSCRTTLESVWTKSETLSSSPLYESESVDTEFRTDRVLLPNETSFDQMVSLSISSCPCTNKTSSNNNNLNNNNNIDIVIDVDKNSLPRKDDKLQQPYNSYVSFSNLELPPIITKPQIEKQHKPEKHHRQQQQETMKNKNTNKNRNKNKTGSINSPGIKLRIKSPKIATKKLQLYHSRKSLSSATTTASGCYHRRRSFSGSVAIVKSSFNPQKDFRESMVEMIVENNIRESKDLEDLLACYLSLNSDEYHQLIIKVFTQIWFDLTENRVDKYN